MRCASHWLRHALSRATTAPTRRQTTPGSSGAAWYIKGRAPPAPAADGKVAVSRYDLIVAGAGLVDSASCGTCSKPASALDAYWCSIAVSMSGEIVPWCFWGDDDADFSSTANTSWRLAVLTFEDEALTKEMLEHRYYYISSDAFRARSSNESMRVRTSQSSSPTSARSGRTSLDPMLSTSRDATRLTGCCRAYA